MKKISIVTPCYNEEQNVELLYYKVKEVFERMDGYNYEHLFIDNHSTDSTLELLKALALKDPNVRVIANIKNFGHIRSPYHAMLQADGDAIMSIVADLQDPPELIPQFIEKWNSGYKIVVGVKRTSEENPVMFNVRKFFYKVIDNISDVKMIRNFTGFGLYDRSFISILSTLDEPYPYFRGLVAELGYDICELPYDQPVRKKGKTKNNLYTLYDMAMLGFISHSKVPLRLASFIGFNISLMSFLIAFGYLIAKLLLWDTFVFGIAPLIIGIFFFSGVQIFFLGIVGEYLSVILTHLKKRPLVIERERFGYNSEKPHA